MNYLHRFESALYYECGYSCDNALLLSLGSEKFFITDGRYELDAKERVVGAEVVVANTIFKKLRELLRAFRVKNIVIDCDEFSYQEIKELKSKLSINIKESRDLSMKKRIIKKDSEIELLKKSVSLNAQAFEEFAKFLETNRELSEKRLHFCASNILSFQGEYDLSFDPIVAINENGAKPHAYPSQKLSKDGDMILFDAGIKYQRYCSDRTRVLEIGGSANANKHTTFKNRKHQKIYDLVLRAQESAIDGIRAGMMAKEVDFIARDVIDRGGYGDFFVHSLGHGVGLDIHELPRVSKNSKEIIEDGMVFTIEPGIYIKDEIGIRIEDVVVIKDGRALVL